ncbi:MAG: O-antigen ligase family protein [Thermincola sp.]|jgi:O-antigen ligase|nr:O-antigen ligase family protein [Thermincola sp.]MDT3703439.1 O-antigen ligase family protein [Thermincola sp.]
MVYYLYLLIAVTPFLAVSPWLKWHGVPTGVIFGGLVGLLVIGTVIRSPELLRWQQIKKTPLVIPLILFFTANLLSTLWNVASRRMQMLQLSTAQELVYLLFATVFYWALVNSLDSRQKIYQSLQAFLTGAAVAAIYGLVKFYQVLAAAEFPLSDPTAVRLYGTAGEPQVFGGFLITLLPLLAAAILYKLNFTRPLFYYPAAVLLLLALTATFSAGALAGFGVAVILLLLFIPYYNFRQLVSLGLIFVLVGSLIFGLATAFPGYSSAFKAVTYKFTAQMPAFEKLREQGDTSLEGTYKALQKSESDSPAIDSKYLPSVRSKAERTWFRAALWNMFQSSPVLGIGPGNFGPLYDSFRPLGSESPPYVPKPHNQYLEILAETGLIGGVAFLWVLGSLGRLLYQCWQAANPEDRRLLLGLAASLAAVGVHAYSFGILVHIQVWLLLAITAAFAVIINPGAGGRSL